MNLICEAETLRYVTYEMCENMGCKASKRGQAKKNIELGTIKNSWSYFQMHKEINWCSETEKHFCDNLSLGKRAFEAKKVLFCKYCNNTFKPVSKICIVVFCASDFSSIVIAFVRSRVKVYKSLVCMQLFASKVW